MAGDGHDEGDGHAVQEMVGAEAAATGVRADELELEGHDFFLYCGIGAEHGDLFGDLCCFANVADQSVELGDAFVMRRLVLVFL